MLQKISRLFVIKTRWEAFMIIYALALGAVERGSAYLTRFPGWGGKLLFLACTGAVFMAGAKILDCLKFEQAQCQRRSKSRPFGGVKPGHRVTCRGEWREGVARGHSPRHWCNFQGLVLALRARLCARR